MKVVTSGLNFLDIDAYACCVAYAELLRLQGKDTVAYSSATINESVTHTIRSWDVSFSTDYTPSESDTFILVDVSEPEYFEKAVDIARVEEVIDHHVGYEEFWRSRIGDKAAIEFIGAACTQVYEKWLAADELGKMSQTSARLLICGILDNTLNFQANVTTKRDKVAYEQLLKIAHLPSDWTAQYFTECQESILKDVHSALTTDIKMLQFKNLPLSNLAVGQIVVWDGDQIIHTHRPLVETTMLAISENWFVNVVSISEGTSYFLCSSDIVKQWAKKILNVEFVGDLAVADRLWLRKEIFKRDQSYSG